MKAKTSTRFKSGVLFLAAATLLATPRAFAVSKEMVQLQTQIQQLQDAVARLQQSNDERMGVVKDLVQQTADSVNKMSLTVAQLQRQIGAQTEAQGTKIDGVAGQVQSLNDSLDELKARLQRIEKSVADVQNTQQSMSARLENGGGTAAPTTTASPDTGATPLRTTKPARNAPPPGFPDDTSAVDTAPARSAAKVPTSDAAPPVADLYQTAYGDYNGARYPLATAEFSDVVRFYPDSNYAGNAYFYLGEILYKQQKYGPATKQYDKVVEQYPGNPKIPAAQLRKGQALLAIKQNDAGVRELRSLIQRFPTSPEATQARSKLSEIGVTVTPKRTAER